MKAERVRLLGRRTGVLRPGHPRANSNGYILESRAVMEERLGRVLRQDEVVHHLNKDTTDNRPENLLLATRAAHTKLHSRPGARVRSSVRGREHPWGRPPTRVPNYPPTPEAARVRELRGEHDITQGELGAELGRSPAWVSCLERGHTVLDGRSTPLVFDAIARIVAQRRNGDPQ